jgi:sulfite oxidase
LFEIVGYIAARSVKWLTHITVQSEPSNNYYQRRAYKLFPTDMTVENDKSQSFDWNRGFMLGKCAREKTLNTLIKRVVFFS